MTKEEAKEIFLNRGFVNGFFDGNKWRQSIVVISEWLKEQESCEDKIIDEHYWKGFNNGIRTEKFRESRKESCDDCISRQEALKQLKGCLTGGEAEYNYVKIHIDSIPPIIPQPKIGHWIEHPHEAGENWEYSKYECSECHAWEDDNSNYCPDCGIKMEE